MKKHEFYREYANIPLEKRDYQMKGSINSANSIYKRIREEEYKIEEANNRIELLLAEAEKGLPSLKDNK